MYADIFSPYFSRYFPFIKMQINRFPNICVAFMENEYYFVCNCIFEMLEMHPHTPSQENKRFDGCHLDIQTQILSVLVSPGGMRSLFCYVLKASTSGTIF